VDDTLLATLTYAPSATVMRLNLGWRRQGATQQPGFTLDVERGYWQPRQDGQDLDSPMSARQQRVIPFVEDRKNSLLIEFETAPSRQELLSVMEALKQGIQVVYQLEDNELGVDLLPSENPRVILFYEAAEGGAGVLRRLCEEPNAFAEVSQTALDICHFDLAGNDLRHAPGVREDCEAACYDCLLSYYNQRYHEELDRRLIRDLLLAATQSMTAMAPGAATHADHLATLLRMSGSTLEEEWLRFLEAHHLNLPTRAQPLIAEAGTRPDFIYDHEMVVVYVDGPVHDFPHRQARDKAQRTALDNLGYEVVRFGRRDDWLAAVKLWPHVFGTAQ
jgi:very-short-patch-repair endonuclease